MPVYLCSLHRQDGLPHVHAVHEKVELARRRSGWSAKRTLAVLGISRRSYYRWLKEQVWARALPSEPLRPVQPYEALAEEKQAVLNYATKANERWSTALEDEAEAEQREAP